MANVVVRPYDPKDEDAYFGVRSLVYNDGHPVPAEARTFRFSRPFVAELEGEVQAVYNVLDMEATRGPARIKMGGIAGVAVPPHVRSGGLGTEMMRQSLELLREERFPLASLYAFREPFYRKVGYEVCGQRLRVTLPNARIPHPKTALPIQRLTMDEWERIDPCFRAFAHARSGVSLRDAKLWERKLGENKPLQIYAAGDPVEAYAVVSHETAFWVEQWVSEVVWTTRRGYEAVISFLRGLAINKTGISWFEPSDSPLLSLYTDQGVAFALERPAMYRVTDVPAALGRLVTEEEGEFAFEVRDDFMPSNHGAWRVRFTPAGVEAERGGEPEFSLDVRQFAQAFLGQPSLTDLARNGLVDVFSARGLRAAERLLPPLPVVLPDFF